MFNSREAKLREVLLKLFMVSRVMLLLGYHSNDFAVFAGRRLPRGQDDLA